MNIHEYQSKEILRRFGVTVPKGAMTTSVGGAKKIALELGGQTWVVKAQIHAGGRGKGGGVRVCDSVNDVGDAAEAIIGMNLITHQTSENGKEVKKIYVEEGCQIVKEFYLSILLDRSSGHLTFVGSTEGGVDIEEVAATSPDRVCHILIDPATGIQPFHSRKLAFDLGLRGSQVISATKFIGGLYDAFVGTDATLIEINPMVLTKSDELIALDAKISFDDNALFRHPELSELRDESEEDPRERIAQVHGLNYIKLEGNIGCMVNGAGLAMATMDIIKLFGGNAANFLDVGGGATKERVTEAFKIILSDSDVKGVLVNIFGGIMRCDVIAGGIVTAVREVCLEVPLVVRLEGTNVDVGKRLIAESGLSAVSADNLADAAQKIVRAVSEDV